ncbi:MAG TPA: hypothetical protein VJH03_00450 [Blastocatellia bacterium]|nr:hypothetical protein [Blastocatellia bacterium]
MKIVGGNPLRLECEAGETVTVRVLNSIKILDLVNYKWDGPDNLPGPTHKDTPISGAIDRRRTLGVQINYPEDSGGSFTMQATGDHGGDVSTHQDEQADGEEFSQFFYIFTVAQ